jgi:hypothetical protein
MRGIVLIVSLLVLLPGTEAWSQTVTGDWEAAGEIKFSLIVAESADGSVTGRLSGGGMTLELDGRQGDSGFVGVLAGGGVTLDVAARLDGSRLRLEMVDTQSLTPDEEAEMVLILQRVADQVFDSSAVVVNGLPLMAAERESLERQHRLSIEAGVYWYDARSGAWGLDGAPTAGFVVAGLPLGGLLRADASGGDTGVFVNGRELHRQDASALEALLGTVVAGRYWLDADGGVGLEGGPVAFNLFRLARTTTGSGAADDIHRSNITGIGRGSSVGSSHVMGKDWAVTVGD